MQKIQMGEKFFKERDNNLFDTKPAVWRNLSIEARHDIVNIIKIAHLQEKQFGPLQMFGSSLSIVLWMKYPKLEQAT
jgi:hypothetical protein